MIKEKYINPFTDFGFKKLFGTEPNKDLLIDFLNQILPPYHRIQDLTYTKNEHIGNTELDRKAVFDLYCTSENGDKFIVEIQKAKQNFFKDRSVFYATFPIQEQAKRGEWDYKLAAVYTVGILDFVFEEDKNDTEVRHVVQLKNQDCKVFYDKLTFIYLEMPKFLKNEDQLKTTYDKWLYVLKHLPYLDKRPQALQERIFHRLFEAAEIAKFSPSEREQYQDSLKYYWDLKNVTDTARDEGYEEGVIKGYEEGVEQGMRAGIEQGIEQGIEKAKIEMAKKMKEKGIDLQIVADTTGLSISDIEKL